MSQQQKKIVMPVPYRSIQKRQRRLLPTRIRPELQKNARVRPDPGQERQLSTSFVTALSVVLHVIALIGFATISSFALDFLLMVGRWWGFVLGALLYGAFYLFAYSIDEDV